MEGMVNIITYKYTIDITQTHNDSIQALQLEEQGKLLDIFWLYFINLWRIRMGKILILLIDEINVGKSEYRFGTIPG